MDEHFRVQALGAHPLGRHRDVELDEIVRLDPGARLVLRDEEAVRREAQAHVPERADEALHHEDLVREHELLAEVAGRAGLGAGRVSGGQNDGGGGAGQQRPMADHAAHDTALEYAFTRFSDDSAGKP
jgi:hypothetical protein